MRQSRITTILLYCFFSLLVGSRSSIFAQQPPQANEKEQGIELYRKGAFSEAVKALKEAVKKQQSDSDAWYYLGLSLHRTGEIKDARKAIEKAISLKPDFAPSYTAMAYMQLLDNDNKGAVKNAEKALALDPKNYESLYIAGVVCLRENAAAEALARAEEALKIKPDYPRALLLKTEALMGMFVQERDKWNKSLDQRERNKLSSEAGGLVERPPYYSLLKPASESLEAYLKLTQERSEQTSLSERLEAIRFYVRWAEGSEKSVAPMTRALRPTIHYREAAPYTEAARDAGIRGIVVLMAVFAYDATIKHIMAIQGLSHGLTEEAIAAARKIKFTPAMGDGKPISVTGALEFTFNP
ncbi:MAG TPA: tetratricopeptide repeat protein [Blastocatellia bacterium]|nr:tetratricopeptide repeat protein [Blastocatellia bacterium]